MAKTNNDKNNKKTLGYHSPLILLLAAVYLGFMAYQLGNTIYQGTVSGGGLIVSWVGMIAFIIIAIGLAIISFRINSRNKKALDEELAAEQEELDKLDLDAILDEDEEEKHD